VMNSHVAQHPATCYGIPSEVTTKFTTPLMQ
jgi:hypothetical protein